MRNFFVDESLSVALIGHVTRREKATHSIDGGRESFSVRIRRPTLSKERKKKRQSGLSILILVLSFLFPFHLMV